MAKSSSVKFPTPTCAWMHAGVCTAYCGTAYCGTAHCGTAYCGTAYCGTAYCGTAYRSVRGCGKIINSF